LQNRVFYFHLVKIYTKNGVYINNIIILRCRVFTVLSEPPDCKFYEDYVSLTSFVVPAEVRGGLFKARQPGLNIVDFFKKI
jgi:hypothetical protein